ncbi:MAG TPA: hypothetical protein VK253_07740 [Candidatus Binatia bacterium]|nr:hypothetical protein [Candidatus Binatia bacterium]
MSNNDEPFECLADRFGLKRLYPRGRLFSGAGAVHGSRGECEDKPSLAEKEDSANPDIGQCEFAVGLVFGGSENRTCVCGCFCPATVFKDPKVFSRCDTRKEQLAAEQT